MSDAFSSRSYSRVALALSHAAVDAETQPSLIAFRSNLQSQLVVDYVTMLKDECNKYWEDYVGHVFPKQLAADAANLNGFRHYIAQDVLYLDHYYRFRMEEVAKEGTYDNIKDAIAKLASGLDWVKSIRKGLTTKLGVPASEVDKEPSTALQNSIALHKQANDWLDVHIVFLPCIWGYYTIASELYEDGETVTNSIYYPMWILENKGDGPFEKYKKFINDSIGSLDEDVRKERWSTWIHYFTEACKTEMAFFDLGLRSNPRIPTYNVVKDGIYKIFCYRTGFSLVGRPDNTVEMSQKLSEGIWELTNSVDGYAFRTSIEGRSGLLTVNVDDIADPTHKVRLMANDVAHQRWSITSFTVEIEQEKRQAFQISILGRTGYVLDAGRSTGNFKVFATNNSQLSSQVWIIYPVTQV